MHRQYHHRHSSMARHLITGEEGEGPRKRRPTKKRRWEGAGTGQAGGRSRLTAHAPWRAPPSLSLCVLSVCLCVCAVVPSLPQYVDGADFVIPVKIEDTVHKVYVLKRPGVDEFMVRMSQIYEIVIFTASLSLVSTTTPQAGPA